MDASTDPKFTHLVNTGHVVSFHERWQCVPGGSSGTEAHVSHVATIVPEI